MNFSENNECAERLLLIDGIAPFFRGYKKKRINWSKVAFEHLETAEGLHPKRIEKLRKDFQHFCRQVAVLGYTGVTLDDVAHLVPWYGHPAALQKKIAAYRSLYAELFDSAVGHGLKVYLTTDLMFYTPQLLDHLGTRPEQVGTWLGGAFTELFNSFPQIAGIVTRFGESDGGDVKGDFHSRLILKTTRQLRQLIKTLLPCFEAADRTWIFRTWSVGVHPVGDLMWHRKTFQKAFTGFEDAHFILSLKYGESDFFRYLPLNANFFRTGHRKIIELQARREYEGFGEYPSFTGWEYERYLRQVEQSPGFCGAMVWAQTGGWGRFRRLLYGRKSSVWVELNVEVTAELCRGAPCGEAIEKFRAARLPGCDPAVFRRFLELSDQAILNTLYVPEFAARKLFFRRLRVPPFFCTMWDRLIVTRSIRRFARLFVEDRERSLEQARDGVAAIQTMIQLARDHDIPDQGLELELDTFRILLAAREYFFLDYSPETSRNLECLKDEYSRKYEQRYRVRLDFRPTRLRKYHMRVFHLLLFRQRRGYRLLDHVLALRLLPLAYPVIAFAIRRLLPKSIRKQAMGVEVLFR